MPESEEIAEIGAGFIQDAFRLGFAAVIIRAGIVKRAVQAAMQIRAADGALGLSSGINIIRNFIEAFVTSSHHVKKIHVVLNFCQANLKAIMHFRARRKAGLLDFIMF